MNNQCKKAARVTNVCSSPPPKGFKHNSRAGKLQSCVMCQHSKRLHQRRSPDPESPDNSLGSKYLDINYLLEVLKPPLKLLCYRMSDCLLHWFFSPKPAGIPAVLFLDRVLPSSFDFSGILLIPALCSVITVLLAAPSLLDLLIIQHTSAFK